MSSRDVARRILELRDSPAFAGRNDLRWFLGQLVRELVLPETDGDVSTADLMAHVELEGCIGRAIDDVCGDCPRRVELLERLVELLEQEATD